MPRAASYDIYCAYAEDPRERAREARAVAKARQALLTPEEKEQKKALTKAKKEWRDSLKLWQPADRGKSFPDGTKVCASSILVIACDQLWF